ncbi:hypothetical protein CHARACLAT_031476 [Characodon lateralis]|uniref:Uncharacterized protein n=1 Tax=Characodon lateralis TaxID=208331 RepID=A0ABU7DC57_9TELE|nr:hypothetical protein [Characodon lateralis]
MESHPDYLNSKHLQMLPELLNDSQSGSVSDTIMVKPADWTDVQKTVTDSLHKEGKPQKSLLKKLVVHRVLYSGIFIESKVEGKRLVGKSTPAKGVTTAFRGLGYGGASQGAD